MKTNEHNSENGADSSVCDRQRIAVIDDEYIWLKTFKRILRDRNYSVDTYANPQEFLTEIAQHPNKYAGIICDIKMPQMSGYQVFEAVKQNQETQNIPFLIVSGVLTQDHNLSKVQGMPYVSKLDDNLRAKLFEELIDVIENWPKVKIYLQSKNVPEDKIEFICQFHINYHKYFNEILEYVIKMEQACVNYDDAKISIINQECNAFMTDIHKTCMGIITILQNSPEASNLVKKVCERGRTSLTMIQHFQFLLTETPTSNKEFRTFLHECKESLEKIIIGAEKGFNLRDPEMRF